MHTDHSNADTDTDLKGNARDSDLQHDPDSLTDEHTSQPPSEANQPAGTSLGEAADNPVIEKIRG